MFIDFKYIAHVTKLCINFEKLPVLNSIKCLLWLPNVKKQNIKKTKEKNLKN